MIVVSEELSNNSEKIGKFFITKSYWYLTLKSRCTFKLSLQIWVKSKFIVAEIMWRVNTNWLPNRHVIHSNLRACTIWSSTFEKILNCISGLSNEVHSSKNTCIKNESAGNVDYSFHGYFIPQLMIALYGHAEDNLSHGLSSNYICSNISNRIRKE